RREDELGTLARDQLTLLSRASEVVRPGGRLVYATCSSEPEENEQVADTLLERRRDFRLLNLGMIPNPVLAPFVDARGMFRTLPSSHGLEAFFAAVLIRD